jgi:hypothetical protein
LLFQIDSKALKPGGYFLIRDYAKGDLAELRFDTGRKKISDSFFVRKDGTRAYYSTTGIDFFLIFFFSSSIHLLCSLCYVRVSSSSMLI